MASDLKTVSSLYGGFWNFDVQDFCYMTNRYFPPPGFFDSLGANLATLVTAYPSTNRHLSSLVAEPLGLSHDQVVLGNGASEILSVLIGLRVKHLAVPVPTFDEYLNRARVRGAQVNSFMMDDDFGLDVDGFIAHVLGTGANSVVLVRPNNPSGTLVSREDTVRMLQAFGGLDLVIVDESFLFFASADWQRLSVMDVLNEFPNLVIVNSMSKAYGVPGLRLGYAASADTELIARLRAEIPIWSINSLAQFFLEHVERYASEFAESCLQVTRATQHLYQGLLTVPYLRPYPTHGNYVLCRTSPKLTGTEIVERLFDEHHVIVNDCGGKHGLDRRFFRIAARTSDENEWLVGRLRDIDAGTQASERAVAPDGARR